MTPTRRQFLTALPALGSINAADPLETLLVEELGFSSSDLAVCRNGKTISRALDTPDGQMGLAGAIRLSAPAERFVRAMARPHQFEKGKGAARSAAISNPARVADFAAFSWSDANRAALRECRPGSCSVKLPSAVMEQLRREVPWGAAQEAARADAEARKLWAALVDGYRKQGSAGLWGYDDQPEKLPDRAAGFKALLAGFPILSKASPNLADTFLNYPGPKRSYAEVFWWAEGEFGLKPVFRINHRLIAQVRFAGFTAHAAATRMIYANHYFREAVELRMLVVSGRNSYLVSASRSSMDGIDGFAGRMLRAFTVPIAEQAMIQAMESLKRRLSN